MVGATYKDNGYQVLRKLVDPSELANYIKAKGNQTKEATKSEKKNSHEFYKDKKFEKLLLEIKPKIEECVGLELYETYSFARLYKEGDILIAHRDRPACQISITMSLENSGTPWPIWLNDYDEKAQCIILEPGDALIYKGIDFSHWRERNIFGPCSQVFLHYVDKNGPYAIHRQDKNKLVRLNFNLFNKRFSFHIGQSYGL